MLHINFLLSQYLGIVFALVYRIWKLIFTNKQRPQKECNKTFPQTKRNTDILKHSFCKGHCSIINNTKSKKGREAKDCKQTKIVSIPIRLNRKLGQLDVYSEHSSRVQGLWREHFLASKKADGKVSWGRWQWRQFDFLARVYNAQRKQKEWVACWLSKLSEHLLLMTWLLNLLPSVSLKSSVEHIRRSNSPQ